MKKLLPFILLFGILTLRSEQFTLLKKVESIPENGQVTRVELQTDAGKFSFIPPANWLSQVNSPDKSVVFKSPALQTTILFRISTNQLPNASAIKQAVQKEFEGSKIEEFKCYGQNREGLGFSVSRPVGGGVMYMSKLGVFPGPNGIAELRITAPSQNAEQLEPIWTSLLNSFRWEDSQAQR